MTSYDSTGIETWVKENNSKYLNSTIHSLTAFAKANDSPMRISLSVTIFSSFQLWRFSFASILSYFWKDFCFLHFHFLPNIVYHSFQIAFPYFASVYCHIGLHLPSTIRVEQTFVAQLFFSIWSFPLLRDCFAVLYNVFIITSRIGVARCFCTVLISRWNSYGFTNCTADPLVWLKPVIVVNPSSVAVLLQI